MKKNYEKLEKSLLVERKSVWETVGEKGYKEIFTFCDGYLDYLNAVKTERQAVHWFDAAAKKKGYKPLSAAKTAKAGDRFVITVREKNIALITIGTKSLAEGVRIVASHIDSPRIDIKQNPLYQDTDLAFFDTHYYGGIKKYQWVSIPLMLAGIVVTRTGTIVNITLGGKPGEPVFTILDLLPHLSHKAQDDRKARDVIKGEDLNLLVGSIPVENKKVKEKVKLATMVLLNEKYGITEADFVSAELCAVPAFDASELGFDRSMIGGYGQDDRVCAYAAYMAETGSVKPKHTTVTMMVDKEEIGSDGNTGMKAATIDLIVEKLIRLTGSGATLHEVFAASHALSADVNGAIDPDYKSVHEPRNAARLGFGVCLTKFTGSGGKYSASDANAEYVGTIRILLDKAGVVWQTGELGKVDEGGGGTIAKYIAEKGIEVIDMGTALLAMHSPFEVASKADIWSTYRAYKAFIEHG